MELGGKAANIIFDDAPLDQAVEGIVNGIFFNQGHVCCAGSRLLVQEGGVDEVLAQAEAPHRHAARRRSDGQEHRRRRDQLDGEQLDKITELVARRREGRRGDVQPACNLPSKASTSVPPCSRRDAEPPHRPRGNLRPRAQRPHLPHRGRSHREGEQHRLRLSAPVSGPTKGSRILKMSPRLNAGVVWANTYNKFDPTSPVRRLQGKRLRPRRWAARPRALPLAFDGGGEGGDR